MHVGAANVLTLPDIASSSFGRSATKKLI